MRAIIFDLGQVLVHYEHPKTMAAVAALCQLDGDGANRLFHEVAGAIGVGQLDAAGLHRFFNERAGAVTEIEHFLTAFSAGLSRIDSALAYAVELQARPGVTIGIISNTNEAHVAWLDEHLPELQQFDLVIMSNEVGMAKPDPEIFRLALELLEVAPDQTIFIDDLAENVQAAQALGLYGIVHTDWAITRPALEAWLARD